MDDERTFARLASFAVTGTPQPKGSTRSFAIKSGPRAGKIRTIADNDADLARWTDAVRAAALRSLGLLEAEDATPTTGPVYLRLRFRFRRPASHYTARGQLTARAPRYHVQRPDRDKLERAVADALTGIVWRDDSQIIDGRASKSWAVAGIHEGASIEAYLIGEPRALAPLEAARATAYGEALAFPLGLGVDSGRDEIPTRDAPGERRNR